MHIHDYTDVSESGVCDCDHGHRDRKRQFRVFVDGHVQYLVADHHIRIIRDWGRFGELQRRGEHHDERAHRHVDDRRTDVHGEPAGGTLHVYNLAHQPVAAENRWHRDRDGDNFQRLQLDRDKRCHLGDDHERRERQRFRNCRLQRDREHGHVRENRDPDHRRQVVHDH